MSSFLSKNKAAWLEQYPRQADVFDAKGTSLQVLSGEAGTYLLEEGKLIDSGADEFWKTLDLSPGPKAERIVLVGGFGLGFLLERILRSEFKSAEYYIIVEPKADRFRVACERFDFSSLIQNKKFLFLVGRSEDECFAEFVQWLRTPQHAFRMDAHRIMEHPVLGGLHREYFDIVWDEWIAATKQIRRGFGEKEDSLLGFQYFMENLSWVEKTPGVIHLKDQFKGVPAIIVATGPSLKKSLDQLKTVQDKAILIAADASLSILLDAGIEPHFFCTLERDLVARKFFETASQNHPEARSSLVPFAFIPRESTEAWKGRTWVAYRDYSYFKYFEQGLPRGILASSSSVAHFCLRLASYLGCGPIVLVGQDLSYDPKTLASHPSGIAYGDWSRHQTLEELEKRIKAENLGHLVWVEGNLEPQLPSSALYFAFIKEYAWEVTQLKVPLINCTQGGAKIPGVPWRDLSEISKTWITHPNLFERIASLHRETIVQCEDFPGVKGFLKNLIDKLAAMQELTKDFESQKLSVIRKQETLGVIRAALNELYQDPRFVCFILQNSGREILEIENQYEILRDDDPAVERRIETLRLWIHLVVEVAQRTLNLMQSHLPTSQERRTAHSKSKKKSKSA